MGDLMAPDFDSATYRRLNTIRPKPSVEAAMVLIDRFANALYNGDRHLAGERREEVVRYLVALNAQGTDGSGT